MKQIKLTIGRKIEISFYDHCSHAKTDKQDVVDASPTIITLIGTYVGKDEHYYTVEVINCNTTGNSEYWRIIKNTVIKIRGVL